MLNILDRYIPNRILSIQQSGRDKREFDYIDSMECVQSRMSELNYDCQFMHLIQANKCNPVLWKSDLKYGSDYETPAVLLPGFAINW